MVLLAASTLAVMGALLQRHRLLGGVREGVIMSCFVCRVCRVFPIQCPLVPINRKEV